MSTRNTSAGLRAGYRRDTRCPDFANRSQAVGYKPRLVDLRFEDDPIIAARRNRGIADDDGFEPGKMVVRPVKRDARGVWHVTRDLEMIRE